MLYNHPHYPFPELLITTNRTLHPLNKNSPFSQSHWALVISIQFSVPVNGIVHLSFCVWLISLCLMSRRFLHVVAGDRISFLFKAE